MRPKAGTRPKTPPIEAGASARSSRTRQTMNFVYALNTRGVEVPLVPL
jgi:hypothetical protein